MGTIAEKLTYLNDTRLKIKDSLNKFGADLTENDTFRSYSNVLNDIYDKLPKVSGNGSNFTLESVQNGKLDLFEMEGNTIQGKLPSEYTQVDYIESSGTQYIDTGYIPNENTRTIIDFIPTTSLSKFIFGARKAYSNNAYDFYETPSTFRDDYGNKMNDSITKVINTRYLFDKNKNISFLYQDNVQVYTNIFDVTTINLNFNMYLFALNNNGTLMENYLSSMKLYNCKIYDNDTLVRDFIPCYRNSDNEVGLYDLVNDVFYTNEGTGAFTYGAIAPTPDNPIDIEIVENKQVVNVRSNQLLDYTDTYNISNETYVFENDILTLNQTPNTTYAFLTYRITELIKNNPGKEVKFSYENIDLSNFNSPNNTIVQLRINKGSTDEYIRLLYKNLTQETYVIPNDTSDIVYVNLGIFTNNSSTSLTLSKLVITKPLLYFDNNNEYSKYHNQDYEIDLHSKNLIPTDENDWEQGSIGARNGLNQDSTLRIRTKEYYKIENDKDYYISLRDENYTYVNIILYDLNKIYLDQYYNIDPHINGGRNLKINIPSSLVPNVSYMRVVLKRKKENDIIPSEIGNAKPQIELGTESTSFEEFYDYKLCKIGDYKDVIFKNNQLSSYYDSTLDEDNWYIKKNTRKYNLSELNWVFEGSYSSPVNRTVLRANSMGKITTYLSNIFKSSEQNDSSIPNKLVTNVTNTWFLSIADSLSNIETSDSENVKIQKITTFIANNNIEVLTYITTPTYEKITNSTLISQLEAIETENGTNIFEVSNENNVLPSLNVKRLKELEKLS